MTVGPDLLLGLLLGLLVGIVAGAAWERWGQDREQGSDEVEAGAPADIAALRVEWKDTLDRIEHLYDRIRKRAQVRDTEPHAGEAPNPGSVDGLSKEQLRAYARSKGMM